MSGNSQLSENNFSLKLEAVSLQKIYNNREIFSRIQFSIQNYDTLVITGRNGSGKSTLVKIVASLISPSSGKVNLIIDNKNISAYDRFKHIGFVSPYLQMYEEFTAVENLKIFSKVRGLNVAGEIFDDLLRKVNLFNRREDLVRNYSSGMKQRLKYAFAILHKPKILILDEPRSNLDNEGISIVYDIVREQQKQGITIIATNEKEDISLGDMVIDLGSN